MAACTIATASCAALEPRLTESPNLILPVTKNYVSKLQEQIRILAAHECAVMPTIKDESNPRLSSGKVPSFLLPNGKPQLLSGRSGWSTDDLKAQIQLAQDHGKSFGIAIQPPEGIVIIDLDVTNYPGGQPELLEDYNRLLRKTPDLLQTRTETTTSGGLHIYVKVEDLKDWKQKPDSPSLRKNLATQQGGTKRGELLSSNSVCIAAPSYGRYTLNDDTDGDEIIVVPTLSDLGIFPVGIQATASAPLQPIVTATAVSGDILLRDLIGSKAILVLEGEYAYRDTNSPKKDRSLQLTGFAKEAYGCENLATEHGVSLFDSADELIQEVVEIFDLKDKADRILAPLQAEREHFTAGSPSIVKKKLGISSRRTRGEKSYISADIAEEEARKALGNIRELIRTGEIILEDGTILDHDDLDHMYLDLSKNTAFKWTKVLAKDAIRKIGRANRFDHIKEHFLDLASTATPLPDDQWNRLDQLILGIDHPIAAEFLPKYLIGAVTRLMQPGCPYVATPILIGGQGIGKSASAKVLFGDEHVVDELGYSLGKDDVTRSHRFFCTELSEVDGVTSKADRERLKAFLTRTVDVYRPAYGSLDVVCPRRFVFWGTSNGTPLNDPTGNRRFVAIDLQSKSKADPIPLDQIRQYRAAIWARAFQEYHKGTSYEIDAEMQERVNSANSLFTVGDSWKDRLEKQLDKDPGHTCLTIDDALTVLEIPPAHQNATSQKRMREILEGLGYRYAKVTLPNGSRVSRFTRKLGVKQRPIDLSRCLSLA